VARGLRSLTCEGEALTRTRDALAAERRRLPMTKVEDAYIFEGAEGKVSHVDLFDGRPQLPLSRPCMFNLAIDSKLHGCDVVAIRVEAKTRRPPAAARLAAISPRRPASSRITSA
jgi:predicted dithiol-disulfide oxidoreductase (DUF899 family)